MTCTGRLAPSPTGALHLGNVRTFMIAYLRARSQGGRLLMRMEDLDHPRDKPGAAREAIEDLRWLGFEWDGEIVFQSGRRELYRDAIGKLREKGLAYPCTCSRKDVESAQSAPHEGEQLRYPGTCRGKHETFPPGACWRFRVDGDSRVAFDDAFAGRFEQDVGETLGDFPLARDEGGAGYTLAVVVDDAEMGVTEVVRADDLLPATPAQILVQRALGLPTPGYFHVPLVVGPDGRRLAKRHGDTRISSYRARGARPERIIGYLAESFAWAEKGEEIRLADLVERFSSATIPHEPLVADFDVF
ncbi:MAG: tRNA glutamyl-Q(34) synthetase GluQRS [Kiritimatiellae bacterium]|nr:tRNA glutamyl-Q(34) synthetase GluQRS [Kiritimatiellia bacterium]